MSENLAVKYRPTSFNEVLGQEPVIESLKAIIAQKGSLPSGMLLSGPTGVGKTTIARVAAKEEGCEERNIIEIDAASHTGVDDMREVTAQMSFLPLGGTKRVVILDEAQRLTKQAFESLLKSMEEPPIGSTWVLCSTEPTKIPQTIKSGRMHHYKLEPVKVGKILERLKYVATQEQMTVPAPILSFIAVQSKGCVRQALTYLSMARHANSIEKIQELIKTADISDAPSVIEFCRALYNGIRWEELIKTVKAMEGEENESVRLIVISYFTKTALGTPDEHKANRFLQIIDKFSSPFNPAEKMGPVLLAAAKCLL